MVNPGKTVILLLTWALTCVFVIGVILLAANVVYQITSSVELGALTAIGLFAAWMWPKKGAEK